MNSSWTVQVDPKSNDSGPSKRHKRRRQDREEEPCEHRGRDQMMLPQAKNSWSPQKLEEAGGSLERGRPYRHLDFELLGPEL